MKAVVLARGKGTRMQRGDARAMLDPEQTRMADAGLKAMIPFGRPFLDYILSALADAGVREVCLVIGPEHDAVREYYTGAGAPARVRLSFAIQAAPIGTADAVLAAAPFAGADPFLTLNADTYYPVEVFRTMIALDGPGLPAFRRSTLIRESNIEPGRVRSYAILEIGPDGYLTDIIEKPDPETFARFGDDFFVSLNCWRFGPAIFEACRRVEPSPRGEVELPNAVRLAVRQLGQRLRAVPVETGILDLSRRSDVAEVERRLRHIEPRP